MKAPEKIYIDTNDNLSDSVLYGFIEKRKDDDIEYVRTDAFMEKACEFLTKSSNYNEGFIYPSHSGVIDAFVNNFKNYMKGE